MYDFSKSYVVSKPVQENERPLPELPIQPHSWNIHKSSSVPEEIYQEVSSNDHATYELAPVRSPSVKISQNNSEEIFSKNYKPNKINLNYAWKSVKKNAVELTTPNSHSNAIVKIIRHRFSMVDSPNRNLETFSKNSKLETFQASPPKDNFKIDSLSIQNNISNDFKLIDTMEQTIIGSNTMEGDQKPMVLLKPDVMGDDETSSKKVKKSPTVPAKPKKFVRKLNF